MILIDGSKDSLQDRCFGGFIKILGIIGQNKEPFENNFQQPDIFKNDKKAFLEKTAGLYLHYALLNVW
jgi:hypothetical protein